MTTAAEVLITDGTVVDGTGGPGYAADVLVRDGRVAAVAAGLGASVADSVPRIDAADRIVAPGFIDIHTHYDAQVFWDPALTPSCFHGVTTVVAGNCGFSIAPVREEHHERIVTILERVEDMNPATLTAGIPWGFETFGEYLAAVRSRGTLLNFAAYVGHTPTRLYVMGDEASQRPATPEEIDRMAAIVAAAMDDGAAGFATSFGQTHLGADGRPIPSRWADRAELDALFEATAAGGRGVVAINGATDALHFNEIYERQMELGVPFTFTALLTVASGVHHKMLRTHRAGVSRGAQVWPQVSCRPLSFSFSMDEVFPLNANRAFGSLVGAPLSERRAAYADPAWRQAVREGWERREGLVPEWDTYRLMECSANPSLAGMPLTAVAASLGRDELDALLDLTLDEPDLRLRVQAILANGDEAGVAELLTTEGCTLGLSDAGAHVGQLCDAPLSTDLLGGWVRERGVLSLEEAVHKLTQVQAELFGFADRGTLAVGQAADVVVFDPRTVAPGPLRRVRDFPADASRLTADQPTGVDHVIVNGVPVVSHGVLQPFETGARPGRVVSPA
jgi:N-acyl-D-aspartate/D-glutamate deacylase